MENIIKQEIDIEEALKKKLEFVCSFCNTKCEIQKATKHLNNEMDEADENFIKQTKRTTTHCSCPLISHLIISGKNKRTIIIY